MFASKHFPSVYKSIQANNRRLAFDQEIVAIAYGSYRATHFRLEIVWKSTSFWRYQHALVVEMTARRRGKRRRSLRSLAFETSGRVADVFNIFQSYVALCHASHLRKKKKGKVEFGGEPWPLRPRCSLMCEAQIWTAIYPIL